ncbi:MAG: hypothetical protein RR620_08640 [Clostridium sp.]
MEIARIRKSTNKNGKTLFVIPNHLCQSSQFAKEFLTLYPQANILATTSKDFSKVNRRKILAKMVLNNWDAVIIPHSALTLIPLKPNTESVMLEEDLKELKSLIDYYKENDKSFSVKQIEKMIEDKENKLKELNDIHKDTGSLFWEDLGIDTLIIDEVIASHIRKEYGKSLELLEPPKANHTTT